MSMRISILVKYYFFSQIWNIGSWKIIWWLIFLSPAWDNLLKLALLSHLRITDMVFDVSADLHTRCMPVSNGTEHLRHQTRRLGSSSCQPKNVHWVRNVESRTITKITDVTKLLWIQKEKETRNYEYIAFPFPFETYIHL